MRPVFRPPSVCRPQALPSGVVALDGLDLKLNILTNRLSVPDQAMQLGGQGALAIRKPIFIPHPCPSIGKKIFNRSKVNVMVAHLGLGAEIMKLGVPPCGWLICTRSLLQEIVGAMPH